MGTSASKASPLAPAFERLATWDLKASRGLLQTYKDKDMDFGLDSQGLAGLVGGDREWAERIIDAFQSRTGIINALAFICGACLVSSGPALEKAGIIFDALDFDGTEQISMDEMTISLLCCARGFCVMAGVGTIPSDEELETVTLQAYRELNKGSSQSITKSEFTKWILEFASGTEPPITQEVTLQNALEQFQVIGPIDRADEKEGNNISSPPQNVEEIRDTQLHDDTTPADKLPTVNTLQRDVSPKSDVNLADQDHVFIDENARNHRPIELVATDAYEQAPNDTEVLLDGNKLTFDGTELQNTTQIDKNDGGEGNPLEFQSDEHVHQVDKPNIDMSPEDVLDQQNKSDPLDAEIETTGYASMTPDTEYDYPTFGADDQEQTSELPVETPHEAEATDVETREHNDNEYIHVEAQNSEPVAVAMNEAPPESTVASEPENDEFLYEQDEFAQSTERMDTETDAVGVSSLNEHAEKPLPTVYTEQATDSGGATERPEAVTFESESGGIDAQGVVDNDSQGADYPGQVDSTDPTEETSHTNLTAFDTYDVQDPRFDGSSGLPPPESHELLDDR
ncbi:hypothetical protein F443_05151 [Phytophthora nicotianae P1569]|uniref:Uncharacterized protein n=1 Tax=Phytophthora nicotianae P1569 TaxID=1317065 RepID=V9FK86_PHYNI|nr:hypothetical protein F443_05151 [Phytophthora nicotianae P1569]